MCVHMKMEMYIYLCAYASECMFIMFAASVYLFFLSLIFSVCLLLLPLLYSPAFSRMFPPYQPGPVQCFFF